MIANSCDYDIKQCWSYIETYVSGIGDERMIVDDEVVCLDDEEVAVGTLRHQVVGEQLTQRNVDAHRAHHSRPVKHRQR